MVPVAVAETAIPPGLTEASSSRAMARVELVATEAHILHKGPPSDSSQVMVLVVPVAAEAITAPPWVLVLAVPVVPSMATAAHATPLRESWHSS